MLIQFFELFQTEDSKRCQLCSESGENGEGALILRGTLGFCFGVAQVAQAAQGGELQRIRRGTF